MKVRTLRALPLLVAIVGCLLGFLSGARAHGELDEMISEATREISGSPRNPQLYLKRAELKRLHREWDGALADLDRADALSNQWHVLHFVRARVLLDAQWYESAKIAADRFLAREPNHIEALLTRARARVKLGEREGAAEDYTRAITHTTMPMPELYLERAQALAADGGQHLDKALEGLDQGITNLGPVVTLQLAAIDLEVKRNRMDAALVRLDAAMAQSPNKEIWLARRGDVLRKGGRSQEAAEAYTAALQAFEKLPPSRRAVPAMADWEKRIRAALTELAKGGR